MRIKTNTLIKITLLDKMKLFTVFNIVSFQMEKEKKKEEQNADEVFT